MVEKEVIRRSYDELADAYAAQRSANGRDAEILSTFLASLDDPTRILDAGCGQGIPVMSRVSTVATAVGIDLSGEQLRLARRNGLAGSLVQGDMTYLPFVDGAFDAVIALWSIIHVPRADHQTAIDEFARVLRPGGRLLVCEGTDEWAGSNPDWLDRGVEMQWDIAGRQATRAQLTRSGFEITDDWGVPETLEAGDADPGEADEFPWTVYTATLVT